MSDIRHILLVPAEGDPHGLLAEGPCGARPPMAISGHLCGYEEHRNWKPPEDYEYHSDCYMCSSKAALVLAWDGAVVIEAQPYIERAGIDYALLAPFVTYALKGMDIGQGLWPGTLVLLDAEGREVSDEVS